MNTQEFIEKARGVHGDKYDYSKVEYVNKTTKVCIICPEHGEFMQEPCAHTARKRGCPKCEVFKSRKWSELTIIDYIKKNNIRFIRELRTKNKSAYNAAIDLGIIDNLPLLSRGEEIKHKKHFCICYKEAKKYQYRSDFAKHSRTQWDECVKKEWVGHFMWLKYKTDDMNERRGQKIDNIYLYVFQNAIYIGRTVNPDGRDKEHRRTRKDSVYKYSELSNEPIPKMKIIERDLTLTEGARKEKELIKIYSNAGYRLINKNSGGSLGSACKKWKYSIEEFVATAKECSGREDYHKKYSSHYDKARKTGLLNELFPKKKTGVWATKYSYNTCMEAAFTCKNTAEFKKKFLPLYKKAVKKHWLNVFFENGKSKIGGLQLTLNFE